MADQEWLVKCVLEAHQRGATIILTNNSVAESIKALYRANSFDIQDVMVKRCMSSTSADKPKVRDIIVTII